MTEVKLGYALKNNDVFRIDSTYFQKEFLQEESAIRARGGEALCDIGARIRSFGAYSLNNDVAYIDDGIPFIRGVDMKNGRVNFQDVLHISPEAHALLWKSEVKVGTVLLSMSGTVGDIAIASKHWPYPVNSNQDIAKIETGDAINASFLYAFLLSKFGQNYLRREPRGSVQQHVFLSQIQRFEIPKFSRRFQLAIESVVEVSEAVYGHAESRLKAAQPTLEAAAGLESWTPPDPLSYTRRASEAFAAVRLDAQHFKPKFEAMLNRIRDRGSVMRLGDLLAFCERGNQPEYNETGLPVLNSRHIREGSIELSGENRFAIENRSQLQQPPGLRTTIKRGDVLINGTGVGTIGRSAAYLYETNAIPDNHVTVLRTRSEDELDPVFLATQLNSMIGKMQVDKYLKGSSGQIELYPADIRQFRVWIAPKEMQRRVRGLVDQAHASYAKASQDLECAKLAIEIAIEDSEASALQFLSKKHLGAEQGDFNG